MNLVWLNDPLRRPASHGSFAEASPRAFDPFKFAPARGSRLSELGPNFARSRRLC
jgi:hypothetical protein